MNNKNIIKDNNSNGLIEIEPSLQTALAECEQTIQCVAALFLELGIREVRVLAPFSGWCGLRDALDAVQADLENCQRILEKGARKQS